MNSCRAYFTKVLTDRPIIIYCIVQIVCGVRARLHRQACVFAIGKDVSGRLETRVNLIVRRAYARARCHCLFVNYILIVSVKRNKYIECKIIELVLQFL